MSRATLVAILLATATSAYARMAPEPRDCVMNVGPDQVTFTAFQQQRTHETYCRHVPDPGPTMIILDAHQSELRGMNLDIRILRDVGQPAWNDDLEANTEYVLAPRNYMYGNGSVSFEYDFKRDGKYIALVRAINPDGSKEYVGEYFFSVGETIERYMAGAAILAASILVSLGAARSQRKARAAPRP